MIPKANNHHISKTAGYIASALPQVMATTGAVFGPDYLWHINNPNNSDWYIDSEKPALALNAFLKFYSNLSIPIATDIQHALFFEGRDLCDNEAYRHLLDKYEINHQAFYKLLKSPEIKTQTYADFELVKSWGIKGFPVVLLQTEPKKLVLLSEGFVTVEELEKKVEEFGGEI